MSSKHNKAMQQLVELVATERELAGQKASIDAQLKIARFALEAHENKMAGMFAPGEEIQVRSAHHHAMVKVKQSDTTDLVETDITQVPAQLTRVSINKSAIRAKMKLDGNDSVPGVSLVFIKKVVFDVTII
jgi:hypothetical protein